MSAGVFGGVAPAEAARVLFQATGRFHDPCYAGEWTLPSADGDFRAAVEFLLRALRVR
ncbi:hypothetical protein GCM10020256_52790 [Streptomyces thermocoprophilus]